MEMLCGVPVFRGVTTADVPAGETQAQMNPRVTCFHAVFANMLRGLANLDLIEMRAFISHAYLLVGGEIRQVTSVT